MTSDSDNTFTLTWQVSHAASVYLGHGLRRTVHEQMMHGCPMIPAVSFSIVAQFDEKGVPQTGRTAGLRENQQSYSLATWSMWNVPTNACMT